MASEQKVAVELPGAEDVALREAIEALANDYQTSDTHHPDHVLVPTAAFLRVCVEAGVVPHSENGIIERRIDAIRSRHASRAAATIPEGMVPWVGGDCAPADWDGGPTLLRNGEMFATCAGEDGEWVRDSYPDTDIIAYTPKSPIPPATIPGGKRYEARYCPGIPTDCCDFGVVSLTVGKEVCRVWDRDYAERIATLLNANSIPRASDEVLADAGGAVAFVSPDQFATHVDPSDEGGNYLPVRKTASGNFTMPLYAANPVTVDAGGVECRECVGTGCGTAEAEAAGNRYCTSCNGSGLAHAAPAPSDEAGGTAAASRITKDWCIRMAQQEAGYEVGAGMPDHPLRCPPIEAGVPAGMVLVPVEALQEVSDLLAERVYGNPARSSAHNARVKLDSLLAAAAKQATPTDEAVVLGERAQIVWRQDAAPQNGSTIYGHSWRPYRWKAYSPKSEQFRHGIKGRWQAMNEFAGWDNAEAPDEWATSDQIEARRARPAPDSGGEASGA